MNVQELKEYIIDQNKIEYVLEKLNCSKLKEYTKEYRAALPDGNNATAIAIKKDTLSTRIYTGSNEINGDIISLIEHVKNENFSNSFKWLCSILGISGTFNIKKKNNPLDFLKSKSKLIKQELKTYDELVLDKYLKLPHYNLVKEGILPKMQEKFGICFHEEYGNILFPHRNIEGKLIGIKARVTDTLLELSGQKYFYELPYPKSLSLYGIYENKDLIKEKGYVIVVEGEKSTIKLHGFSYPSVSIGGHEISPEQRKLLLDLNVDIIIGYDEGISLDHIKNECKKFCNFRTTYYITNKFLELDDKDSPIDKGYKVFQKLFDNKVLYKMGG